MQKYAKPLQKLMDELSKLPGIGPRTAKKLAFHIMGLEKEEISNLSTALIEVKDNIKMCKSCFNFSETELCPICADEKRDKSVICVVEKPSDMMLIESTNEYRGVYHILHGAISPMDGVGPDDLKIAELVDRVQKEQSTIKEIIIATNPTNEGNTTSLHIVQLLAHCKIKMSRFAQGLPTGSEMDYADENTILRALVGRTTI